MGKILGIDLGEAGSAAGAAAGTAIAPGIGTAVGAAVGGFISDLFGSGGKQWSQAGPGVHEWFTKYGPQEFLDWMRANNADKFGNLDGVKALQQQWIYQKFGHFNHLKNPNHALSGGWAAWQKFFAELGINLDASVAKNATMPAPGGDASGNSFWGFAIVPMPGQNPNGPPNGAVRIMEDVSNSDSPTTPDEQRIIDGLDAAAAKEKRTKALTTGAIIAAGILLR